MLGRWTKHFLILTTLTTAGCVHEGVRRDQTPAAEARAIEFLKREVPAWSRDNGCFSCHNNGDGARALYVATRKGYSVPPNTLADTTAWLVQPDRWEQNQGDPGFSDKRLANIQFAAALLVAFEAGQVRDRRPLQEAARKLAADQGADGGWHIEPKNALGSPATYGSILATYMALKTLKGSEAPEASRAIPKAEAWLRQSPLHNSLAAATLLLASAHDSDESTRLRRERCLDLIARAQAGEGGWGPYADAPPEPFDTAVVLLALAELNPAPGIDEMIQRGRVFLANQQFADGSWPATTRPPGGKSYAQRVSTTAWATLALLETRQ